MKNIPIPSKKDYLIKLTNSCEIFVENLRKHINYVLNPNKQKGDKETYGFPSQRKVNAVDELKPLEDELKSLVKTVKFTKTSNQFQNTLSKDKSNIAKDSKVYLNGDKTTNCYRVSKEFSEDLMHRNITKNYKKSTAEKVTEVDVQDRKVAADLEIEDRVFKTSAKEAYETVKDHKPNYMNNPECRDINPCKPELGKVSKKILSEIILTVREKTGYNQWKNTDSVISWFKNLRTTARSSFIQCDICEYYPSITPELLRKAIIWARKHCDISADDERVIFQARKSFLFYKGQPWVKTKNEDFDVTMGSYDGAEVCDLVGLYLLSQLQHLNVNVGAFRDDWLMHGTLPPRQLEGVKKELCRVFKDNGLRITIEANISNVNFLDVNLDLTTHTYRPYMKPNQTPLYVHKLSNQPPTHFEKHTPFN